jgi:hypothetical protein
MLYKTNKANPKSYAIKIVTLGRNTTFINIAI